MNRLTLPPRQGFLRTQKPQSASTKSNVAADSPDLFAASDCSGKRNLDVTVTLGPDKGRAIGYLQRNLLSVVSPWVSGAVTLASQSALGALTGLTIGVPFVATQGIFLVEFTSLLDKVSSPKLIAGAIAGAAGATIAASTGLGPLGFASVMLLSACIGQKVKNKRNELVKKINRRSIQGQINKLEGLLEELPNGGRENLSVKPLLNGELVANFSAAKDDVKHFLKVHKAKQAKDNNKSSLPGERQTDVTIQDNNILA